jgi:cytochrome P450
MESFDNLMDPAVQACPYSLYQRLRTEAPVYRMPETGFYLITSFALCRSIIKQPDVFLSGVSPMALGSEGMPSDVMAIYEAQGWVPKASCSTSDPPRHTRIRALLNKFFTTAKVRALTPYIEEIANDLIDSFPDSGDCEFVTAFSHPLPMIIISRLLGVTTTDLETFKAWSDAIVEPFGMMISHERELECARLVVEMQHFFKQQIEQRRRQPDDDILTILAHEKGSNGEYMPMDELLTVATIDLLASGNETTTSGISSGMLKLVEQPEILQALKDNPNLIPNFVEEVLRLESPAQGMFREVAQDTRVGDTHFSRGDVLSLRFGAANRDETVFHDAGKIDLHRKKPGNHLAFGVGRHHCVGAPLARQELITSFQVLVRRLKHVSLKEPQPLHKYTPSFFGRNLEALEITFEHTVNG